MTVIGVIAGIITFLLVGAIVGNEVLHHPDAGALPGFVAAIWAAWPFIHKGAVQRYNLLHPVPKQYKAPAKLAFTTIYNLLVEEVYNFGDRWHVVSAEPSANPSWLTLDLRTKSSILKPVRADSCTPEQEGSNDIFNLRPSSSQSPEVKLLFSLTLPRASKDQISLPVTQSFPAFSRL